MWFKQIQIFQLSHWENYSRDQLIEKLEALYFRSCLPSMPSSAGWVSPIDEPEELLVRQVKDYQMVCLQIEEKILPATVIKQAVDERVKEIKKTEERKLRQKEKLALKDDIILTLLPRAFTKLTRVYAYIDSKNKWLILGTTHAKKTESLLDIFQKTLDIELKPLEVNKLSPILTHWLQHRDYPSTLAIEKSCVLQDSQQQNRIIRCQQQDLFANSIQSLVKDGCEVKQLAFSWHDYVNFVLVTENFSLRNLQRNDEFQEQIEELGAETKQQQFDADFMMMAETMSRLLNELLTLFSPSNEMKQTSGQMSTTQIPVETEM
jgi:recombination associated protein RdgC